MNFQHARCHCFYKDIAAMRLKTVTLWMLATNKSPLCGSIRNIR
jgi:hypothetical protein